MVSFVSWVIGSTTIVESGTCIPPPSPCPKCFWDTVLPPGFLALPPLEQVQYALPPIFLPPGFLGHGFLWSGQSVQELWWTGRDGEEWLAGPTSFTKETKTPGIYLCVFEGGLMCALSEFWCIWFRHCFGSNSIGAKWQLLLSHILFCRNVKRMWSKPTRRVRLLSRVRRS